MSGVPHDEIRYPQRDRTLEVGEALRPNASLYAAPTSDLGVAPTNGGDAPAGELDVYFAGPSRARTARDERQGWLFCVSGEIDIQIPVTRSANPLV
jgi:hypothetical protein